MQRSYSGEVRYSRTLADMFAESAEIVRRDLGEFGFIALLGAVFATLLTLILGTMGGAVPVSLIVPFASHTAIVTMATCCAGLRRVDENLEPDSTRAFLATIFRLPFILVPFAPALIIGWAAAFVPMQFDGQLTDLGAGVLGILLALAAIWLSFRRSLYIPALYARGASVMGALSSSAAVTKSAPWTVVVAWAIPLAPALMVGLLAFSTGFAVAPTTLAVCLWVLSMPMAAAMSGMLYAQGVQGLEPTLRPATSDSQGSAGQVQDRLRRHMR
jgi:hypothetical protein